MKSLVAKYTTRFESGTQSVAWESIGEELGKSAQDCFAKYQQLKDHEEVSSSPDLTEESDWDGGVGSVSACSNIAVAPTHTRNSSSSNGNASFDHVLLRATYHRPRRSYHDTRTKGRIKVLSVRNCSNAMIRKHIKRLISSDGGNSKAELRAVEFLIFLFTEGIATVCIFTML